MAENKKIHKSAAAPIKKAMNLNSNKSGGLYDPKNEHDACGLGFIANINGVKSHKIIQDGIRILENLEHRGATGADPLMGDGAGMLIQIPHELFHEECVKLGFTLPPANHYCVGFFFMPQTQSLRNTMKDLIESIALKFGCPLIGWRLVPTDNSCLSSDPDIMKSEPVHFQGFFERQNGICLPFKTNIELVFHISSSWV